VAEELAELTAKNAALSLYCKRKNLEMRRLLNCYKSLKTQWERAGGAPDAFDARAAEVDACFDLKAAQRRLEQVGHLTLSLTLTRSPNPNSNPNSSPNSRP
jgi:hypothetical protein